MGEAKPPGGVGLPALPPLVQDGSNVVAKYCSMRASG